MECCTLCKKNVPNFHSRTEENYIKEDFVAPNHEKKKGENQLNIVFLKECTSYSTYVSCAN